MLNHHTTKYKIHFQKIAGSTVASSKKKKILVNKNITTNIQNNNTYIKNTKIIK